MAKENELFFNQTPAPTRMTLTYSHHMNPGKRALPLAHRTFLSTPSGIAHYVSAPVFSFPLMFFSCFLPDSVASIAMDAFRRIEQH